MQVFRTRATCRSSHRIVNRVEKWKFSASSVGGVVVKLSEVPFQSFRLFSSNWMKCAKSQSSSSNNSFTKNEREKNDSTLSLSDVRCLCFCVCGVMFGVFFHSFRPQAHVCIGSYSFPARHPQLDREGEKERTRKKK